MTDESLTIITKGMKWIPIEEKAMEILKEIERRNEHDIFYKMGLGDILYIALVLFYDEIISHEGDIYDLFKGIDEEFLSIQELNMRFISEFGVLDKKFQKKTEELREKKKYGNWTAIEKEEE